LDSFQSVASLNLWAQYFMIGAEGQKSLDAQINTRASAGATASWIAAGDSRFSLRIQAPEWMDWDIRSGLEEIRISNPPRIRSKTDNSRGLNAPRIQEIPICGALNLWENFQSQRFRTISTLHIVRQRFPKPTRSLDHVRSEKRQGTAALQNLAD
jgi:hypothetical protein